jgi:nucleoside-diphosphate-sugar epimerase
VEASIVRRALVTGAGGFVGGNLVERLLADGDRVRVLVRPENAPAWLEERGAEIVVGDLTEATVRTRAVAECDVVFHVASYVTQVNATEADYLRVNAEATAELARAAAGAGVPRFVFVSSTAIYAPSPVPVDEETPAAPYDAYGRSKL